MIGGSLEDLVEIKSKDIVANIARRIKDRHDGAVIGIKIKVSSLWQILRWARYGQKLEKLEKIRKKRKDDDDNSPN